MENSRILKHRTIANPLFAATVATVLGALFGFTLHIVFSPSSREEAATPFILGFACFGANVGLTISYCSYVKRRLRCKLPHSHPSDTVGIAPYVHAALAGAFLLGCGSIVLDITLNITRPPSLFGEPTGTEFWLLVIDSFFTVGGRMLVSVVWMNQAMISALHPPEDPIHRTIALVYVPSANAIVGAFCGLLGAGYYRLRI